MFRLNLYPEADAKRRARLARTGSTALVTFLVAAILVLTAFHAGSGLLLSERARELDAKSIERQTDLHAMPMRQTAEALAEYRKYVAERTSGVVWAPKLAAVARQVRWPLALTALHIGTMRRGPSGYLLRIEGTVPPERSREADALIARLVESLKQDRAFMEGLADVNLASLSLAPESGATNFQIICPLSDSGQAEEGQDEQESVTLRPERRSGQK